MCDRRFHVHGMEGAGHAERDQPGPGGRVGGEGRQLVGRTGRDNLAAAVVVGRGQSVACQGCQHLFGVPTDHRGHRGGGDRTGRGHRPAPFADEDHGLLGGQHPDAGGCGDLAHRVTGRHTDEGEGVHRMGKEFERGQ
jgi:hypothetical protein